jgi:transposase
MNYTHYVGIDVSKETLDAVLLSEGKKVQQTQIKNTPKAIRVMLTDWDVRLNETLFCLEPTGHYSNIVVATLVEVKAYVWIANPADIAKSIGMQRGKNDQIDALRIAEYAMRFKDKARLLQAGNLKNQPLKELIAQRELLVADKAKYQGQINDMKGSANKARRALLKEANQPIIKQFERSIKQIEKQIEVLIFNDPHLKEQYALLQTIPGVGKILAQTILVYTNGFENFNNPRALACHAGVVPFEYSSGKSIRSKRRISHRANKRLKTLLHMAALTVIRKESELRTYYDRKLEEGKNKMSVLNAIRNKLIYRIFAVINRKSAYLLTLS